MQVLHPLTFHELTEGQCLRSDHVDRPLEHCQDKTDFCLEVSINQLDVFQSS